MWTARVGYEPFSVTGPRYYSLIERFGHATGVPVVLNTYLT